jgi:hypothetical protein
MHLQRPFNFLLVVRVQFANPGLLDLNPDEIVPANKVSPQKKSKKKGPSIIRKKLHWVPIKGKVDGTIWAGPPTDLIAAQPFLIEDEKEFKRLFIQVSVFVVAEI